MKLVDKVQHYLHVLEIVDIGKVLEMRICTVVRPYASLYIVLSIWGREGRAKEIS